MSIQTRTTAVQNELVRLYCKFENNGRMSDPATQPIVEILGPDGVSVIDTVNAERQYNGLWFADYYVPADMPKGDYYDKWVWQWSASASVQEQVMLFTVNGLDSYINFVSPDIAHKISGRAAQLINDLANDFIYESMHIPVYWEQAMRFRQEDRKLNVKHYYYLTLQDDVFYEVCPGDVYTSNDSIFTIVGISPQNDSSSSSSTSTTSNMESSLSTDSNETSSSSLSSSSSSVDSNSSSSETSAIFNPKIILTVTGNKDPLQVGMLKLLKGCGTTTIYYNGFTKKTSRFSSIYNCAFKNWNKDPRPVVRVNDRIVDDGWYSDYDGKIYFDGYMSPEDSVNVWYYFRYFSDEELLSFLDLGLKMMNSVPPASDSYSGLNSFPPLWEPGVLLWAAITALRRLIFALTWQERSIIFGQNPQGLEPGVGANQAITTYQSLLAEYLSIWAEFAKNVKTRKLPNIGQYVTPEYTLPGGRSRWFRYLYKGGN